MHLFKLRKPNIDAVFLEYGDMLYRLAFAHLCNEADAQDVVQDVFLKYMTVQPDFNDSNHQKAWLLRTAVNCCHDLTRRNKVRNFLPLDDAISLADESYEGIHDLLWLMSELPPIYKDVVVLHSLEGFTLEETSEILQISLSAAKMRLSRAREMLENLRKDNNNVH